jgi:hypothetical protein
MKMNSINLLKKEIKYPPEGQFIYQMITSKIMMSLWGFNNLKQFLNSPILRKTTPSINTHLWLIIQAKFQKWNK